jgi:hypothetical protein
MAEKKSILEEALLDIKNIQSALNANTKEILRSVAKEEIDSVVKESLMKNEADYDVEDLDSTEDDDLDLDGADNAPAGLDAMNLDGEESDDDEEDVLGDIEGSEEVAPEMGADLGMDSDDELGGVYDRTGASDDDVMAIYKKLSGEDEIEIVGDEIHLNITEPGEYIVKKGALGLGDDTEDDIEDIDLGAIGDEEDLDLDSLGADEEDDHEDDSDERNFEIEMGDEDEDELGYEDEEESKEDEEEENEKPEEEEEEEEPLEEIIRKGTNALGKHANKTSTGSIAKDTVGAGARVDESTSKKLVLETTKKYNNLLTEAKKLQSENQEFRKALKTFRNQLVETVVFNSNLTYVTRLFMEHSTTKAEKQSIIKRFDVEVSNLVESKKLYKTIANNLESRKPMNESVEGKLIKGVTTSTSKQLNESTAYVDPSTKRILDLINRVENK